MLVGNRERARTLPRIRLKKSEQARLKVITNRGQQSVRVVRRARVLQLLHRGMSARQTSVGAGVGVGTVHRVVKRYCDGGLDVALYEKARPGKKRLLATRQQIAIVAMVCST